MIGNLNYQQLGAYSESERSVAIQVPSSAKAVVAYVYNYNSYPNYEMTNYVSQSASSTKGTVLTIGKNNYRYGEEKTLSMNVCFLILNCGGGTVYLDPGGYGNISVGCRWFAYAVY